MNWLRVCIWLVSCLAPIAANWTHNVTVRGLSLNDGLNQVIYNSTAVYLSIGVHQLKPGDETNFEYMTDIAFLPLTHSAAIQCIDNAGLSFIWSSRITLQDITLIDCSMEQWSTSRDFTSATFQFIKVKVALYFSFCSDITLNSVVIRSSNNGMGTGYGAIFYNTRGSNQIHNSQFISNGGYPLPMGGGVVIEFSYCIPGDIKCPSTGHSLISTNLVSNTVYSIVNNTFIGNTASPSFFTNLNPYPSKGRDYFGQGRGGGLSCVFKGNAHSNIVNMENNHFDENTAQFGGSFYVAFDDDATNNSIFSTNDNITQGQALVPGASLLFVPPIAEGGGALFLYGSEENFISLKLAQFDSNYGSNFGGAIAVKSLISTSVNNPGKLTLDQAIIKSNIAQQGAGIYFINMYPDSKPIIVDISDCLWSLNSVDDACNMSPSHVRCTGVVYTKMLPLTFSGQSSRFFNNKGSALDIHETTVLLQSQTITFTGNRADNGPGIHVSNCGKVIVSNDVDVFFNGNTAFFSGGAIYETGCTLTSLSYAGVRSSQCFIQFIENTVHPDNWNASFFFSNNLAGNEINSIYTDSLYPCAWSMSDSPILTQEDINQTFCWSGWYYDMDTCQSVIQSGPAYINITVFVDPYHKLYTSPGQPLLLPLKAYNSYNQEQYEEVKICLVSPFGSLHSYPTDAPDCITVWTANAVPLTLYSQANNFLQQNCDQYKGRGITVSIETVNPPYPKILAPITFDHCPLYTQFACPECYLSISKEDIGLKCVDTASCQLPQDPCTLNSSLTTTSSFCWNIDHRRDVSTNSSSYLPKLVGGNCPYAYGRSLPCAQITDFLNPPLDGPPNLCPGNRQGRLCGRCAPGFELTTNTIDFRCVKCNGILWPVQLAIQLFVITILIILIVVFSISLNAGGTNAFIFFAQAVTIKYPGLSYPSWIFEPNTESLEYNQTLVRGFAFLYSLSNFDVITPLPLDPFCLSDDFTPIHSILIDFIPAFYPLLLLAFIYCWIALYSFECKPFFGITRSMLNLCKFSESRYKFSLMDSFATISIICFSLITATCFKLLTPTFYYTLDGEWVGTAFYYDGALDYFGKGHFFYAITAIIILVLFVLLPATLLTCSSCITRKFKENRFDIAKISALTGTFNSCFKDAQKEGEMDLRFFAGLYLFLRITVRMFYMLHDAKLILALEMAISIVAATILIGVRPYKNDVYNIIDATIFLYLALMAGVSSAGYAYVFYKGFLYLPLFVVVLYGLFKMCVKLKKSSLCKKKKKAGYILVPVLSDDDEDPTPEDDEILIPAPLPRPVPGLANDPNNTEEMFADRLLNPDQYPKASS